MSIWDILCDYKRLDCQNEGPTSKCIGPRDDFMTRSKIPATNEEQQAAAMLERLYAPLVKKLGLTPEQSRGFYQEIFDNKMKGQAQMAELLRHEDLNRMARTVADFQKETDARLQTLLGSANFAQYQEYQIGIGDRGVLERTKDDFAEHPLTEEQQQLLLEAMEAGRRAAGNATGSGNAGFSVADTAEVMDQKLTRQESIDRHILQQAAGFLSPAQLKILSSTQAKLLAARKNGYEKARAMFGDRNRDSKP
jgi:hypothetical protein